LGGEAREQRRLEAVARADLEHSLAALEAERLDHLRDQRRLRRHLAMRDWERLVDVGPRCELVRHEPGARDLSKGLQEPLIRYAGSRDQPDEILLGRRARTANARGACP